MQVLTNNLDKGVEISSLEKITPNKEIIVTIKSCLYKICKMFVYVNLFLMLVGSLITEMSLKQT